MPGVSEPESGLAPEASEPLKRIGLLSEPVKLTA